MPDPDLALPRRVFVAPEYFARDQTLYRSSWIPVGHVTELEQPGSFVARDVGGERVVVVRDRDLELGAFLDGCIHRGTLLFEEEAGRLANLGITCPYHGLRYDLRGLADPSSCPTLRLAPNARLRPVRVETHFGFVFVCVDPKTPSFREWAGPIPPWLERASMHTLRLGRRTTHEARANWKLLAQNFQESHHFTLVHPTLEARTPWLDSSSVDFGGAFLGGTMALAPDIETVSDVPTREGRSLIAAQEDQRHVRDALLFPGWLTSLQPDYFLGYRLIPLAADRTRIVADIYFHATTRPVDAEHVYSFWDRTNAEDREICERQQLGLASPSYEMGPYATVEDGVRAFDSRIKAFYASDAASS